MIGNTGVPFTPASIGMAMANRELLSNLRAMGEITGGPKPMAQRDRSRFLSALDEAIQKIEKAWDRAVSLAPLEFSCWISRPLMWQSEEERLWRAALPAGQTSELLT